MKTKFLFPRQFRKIGWLILIPALIAALLLTIFGFGTDDFFPAKVFAVVNVDFLSDAEFLTLIDNSLSDEILLVLIVVGGILAGFSKMRNEDELVSQIRYESLVWAVYFNFAVMLVATLSVYGMVFLNVMMVNMFSLLFFFLIRFHITLYRLNRETKNEE